MDKIKVGEGFLPPLKTAFTILLQLQILITTDRL
jgi:hypothetical protein